MCVFFHCLQCSTTSTVLYSVAYIYLYSPEESKGNKKANHSTKRPFGTPGGADANSDQNLSKNKLKKMKRNPNKAFEKREEKFVRCEQCPNPKVCTRIRILALNNDYAHPQMTTLDMGSRSLMW